MGDNVRGGRGGESRIVQGIRKQEVARKEAANSWPRSCRVRDEMAGVSRRRNIV